jgi:hypothetical protein
MGMSFHVVQIPSLAVTSTAALASITPPIDVSNFRQLTFFIRNSSTAVTFDSFAIMARLDGPSGTGAEYIIGSGPEADLQVPSTISPSSTYVCTPVTFMSAPYLVFKGLPTTTATAGILSVWLMGHTD